MPTLQEDIDDLDRMIDGGAAKDAMRSQLRLILREVTALEAEHARLTEDHTKLEEEHAALEKEHAELKAKHLESQKRASQKGGNLIGNPPNPEWIEEN